MPQLIKVGMADYKIACHPNSLISYGLGSCVGIALYDSVTKIGGLAHIMLPDSSQARNVENPAKFADTAIPLLLNDMLKAGAQKQRIIAKIAGGAQMFSFANITEIMRIGERNTESVKNILRQASIQLIANDTGGNFGRTIELRLDTGILFIKTIDKGEKFL